MLDEAGLSARLIADQLGYARPSMTQDAYMGRKAVDSRAVEALEMAFGGDDEQIVAAGEDGQK